ncbi:DgyrCDS3870 [Dimorphilus gyrociliatus]|uniref:DgyrCDS3870 n=1 Tax=Dimorphilus gyrociliatus TaxID=2664684 RepID=A0A7I8VGP7_9ANNE|nr:DgyrCDS3870 [Dimorphilus gyrociliatus]
MGNKSSKTKKNRDQEEPVKKRDKKGIKKERPLSESAVSEVSNPSRRNPIVKEEPAPDYNGMNRKDIEDLYEQSIKKVLAIWPEYDCLMDINTSALDLSLVKTMQQIFNRIAEKRRRYIQYYKEDIALLQDDIVKHGYSLPKNFEPIQEDDLLHNDDSEEDIQKEEVLRRLRDKKIFKPTFSPIESDVRDVKRTPSLKVSMAAQAAAVARHSTSGKIEMNLHEKIKRLQMELDREKDENKILNEKLETMRSYHSPKKNIDNNNLTKLKAKYDQLQEFSNKFNDSKASQMKQYPPVEVLEEAARFLKETAHNIQISTLAEDTIDILLKSHPECMISPIMNHSSFTDLLHNSVRLTWQMVTSDPPLYIDASKRRYDPEGHISINDLDNPDREYYVDFYQWPILLSHKYGRVLSKGRVVLSD